MVMGVDVWDILEFGGLEGDVVFGIISKKDIINLDKVVGVWECWVVGVKWWGGVIMEEMGEVMMGCCIFREMGC